MVIVLVRLGLLFLCDVAFEDFFTHYFQRDFYLLYLGGGEVEWSEDLLAFFKG